MILRIAAYQPRLGTPTRASVIAHVQNVTDPAQVVIHYQQYRRTLRHVGHPRILAVVQRGKAVSGSVSAAAQGLSG
jgi:hypothetical protein